MKERRREREKGMLHGKRCVSSVLEYTIFKVHAVVEIMYAYKYSRGQVLHCIQKETKKRPIGEYTVIYITYKRRLKKKTNRRLHSELHHILKEIKRSGFGFAPLFIHIQTYTNIYIHIHTYAYIYIHIHTYTYIYIHIHTFAYRSCTKGAKP